MKNIFITTGFLLLFAVTSLTQTNINWNKSFIADQSEESYAIAALITGDLILAGSVKFSDKRGKDILLRKCNQSGDIIWEKSISRDGDQEAISVLELPNQNLVIGCSSLENGKQQVLLTETDKSGTRVGEKLFTSIKSDILSKMILSYDTSLVLCGYTNSRGKGSFDFFLTKLKTDFTLIWDKTYGTGADELAFDLIESSEGEFVMAGITKTRTAGSEDAWIVSVDQQGELTWETSVGSSGTDIAGCLIETHRYQFVVAGFSNSNEKKNNDFWFFKLNKGGVKVWDRLIARPTNDKIYAIANLSDISFIVGGMAQEIDNQSSTGLIYEIDQDGQLIDQKTLDLEKQNEVVRSIGKIDRKFFVVTGFAINDETGKSTFVAAKMESLNPKIYASLLARITKKTTGEPRRGESPEFMIDYCLVGNDSITGITALVDGEVYTNWHYVLQRVEKDPQCNFTLKSFYNLQQGNHTVQLKIKTRFETISTEAVTMDIPAPLIADEGDRGESQGPNGTGVYIPGINELLKSRRDYALIFATDNYDNWPALNNPVFDGNTIKQELESNYGFSVELVENPSKVEIFSKLKEYNLKKYGPNDQLFIFIAGHGIFDEVMREGYIICSNSVKNDPSNSTLISHSELRTYLSRQSCDHIFLVMDVCFGGAFSNFIATGGHRGDYDDKVMERTEFIQAKLKYKTRRYMTSGGKEYVSDGIKGKHSPFAFRFIEALRTNGGENGVLTLSEIVGNIEKVKPQPTFGDFEENQPGSDFIFIYRK